MPCFSDQQSKTQMMMENERKQQILSSQPREYVERLLQNWLQKCIDH